MMTGDTQWLVSGYLAGIAGAIPRSERPRDTKWGDFFHPINAMFIAGQPITALIDHVTMFIVKSDDSILLKAQDLWKNCLRVILIFSDFPALFMVWVSIL